MLLAIPLLVACGSSSRSETDRDKVRFAMSIADHTVLTNQCDYLKSHSDGEVIAKYHATLGDTGAAGFFDLYSSLTPAQVVEIQRAFCMERDR